MDIKRTVARNVLWNWAGIITEIAVTFVVTPVLVHSLGDTRYGLWILIGSVTGYFGLLDLGVRSSVGRHIAFHRARNDQAGVNSVLSTALAYSLAAAAVALAGTFVILLIFFYLFDVPADEVAEVRLALLLAGINLAISFPLSTFDATLCAMQRFDLVNVVGIPFIVLRSGLTLYLLGYGHGLVMLASVSLLATAGGGVGKALFSFRVDRGLRLGPGHVRKEIARALFGFGLWSFLLSIGRIMNAQINPLIIGSQLGVRLVTPYNIAARLMGSTNQGLMATTGVLTPVATALHAVGQHGRQQRLFLEGGKYCLTLTLFALAGLLCLGRPFILLWMGPALESAFYLFVILILGEVFAMSQLVTSSMLLGMSRHRLPACMGVVENITVIVLGLTLVRPFGLTGVCVAVAVAAALCRGTVQFVYACRLLELRPWTYAVHSALPAFATSALPAVSLVLLVWQAPPTGWLTLIAYGIAYGVACCAALGLLIRRDHLKAHDSTAEPDAQNGVAVPGESADLPLTPAAEYPVIAASGGAGEQ
jgi:O-antigen/teichoic acid export membrane protein